MSKRMSIAVLGATGMVGSRIVDEASTRGHRVLALSRKPATEPPPPPNVTRLALDAKDPHALHEALAPDSPHGPVDAAVLTVRTLPLDEEFLLNTTRTLLDIAARHGIRVLVIGGAGALRSPGNSALLVADNETYVPPDIKPLAAAGVAQLRTCQSHPTADYVYLSPPALLEPGPRTGHYRRGTDTLLTAPDGRSWISAEDLAVAAMDELETPGQTRHFTLVADADADAAA
ncbi:NAD(P)-dependent oxidoreductase [Streptomyces sp. 7R007]